MIRQGNPTHHSTNTYCHGKITDCERAGERADELIRLAELIERNVAAYTQADIAESLYYAGRVAAYGWCAAEARRAAAALGWREQA